MTRILLIDDDRRHSELLRAYCGRFGIDVDCDRVRVSIAMEGVEDDVMVDEARLILLLKQLLGNALRYSSKEDGPVELSLARRDDACCQVALPLASARPGLRRAATA